MQTGLSSVGRISDASRLMIGLLLVIVQSLTIWSLVDQWSATYRSRVCHSWATDRKHVPHWSVTGQSLIGHWLLNDGRLLVGI